MRSPAISGYAQTLRTPYRAKYFKCASLVGALWQPSFISARPGVAAAAGPEAKLAAAAAPETVTNRRRFISGSLLPFRNYYTSSRSGTLSRGAFQNILQVTFPVQYRDHLLRSGVW